MPSEIPPSEIRQAQFRTVLRGLDRAEVEAFLHRVADRIEELERQVADLANLAETKGPDWEDEFDTLGREVTNILQAAREAAEVMRERAAADAAKWRSEALEEAETNRREAAADAEAMRRDAWVTGTALLEQAETEARRMREQAERDVLTVMGEAEREAHRLTSAARREAEDLIRNATMAAEKMTVDAERRRDDLIEAANRQAAAAQERTRALEQRRDELLEELESVRSTLYKLEESLDAKREALQSTVEESTTVKVVPSPRDESRDEPTWELGETVRVVPGEGRIPKVPADSPPEPPARDIPSEVVAGVRVVEATPSPPVPEEPETPEEAETTEEPPEETEEAVEPVVEEAEAPTEEPVQVVEEKGDDDLDSLFAALKTPAEAVAETPTAGAGEEGAEVVAEGPAHEPEPHPEPEPEPQVDAHDWIEERDSRLLPITNRALRGTKKAITELQNIALDQLRTDDKWQPDQAVVAEALGADLIALWAESFAAGHAVAEAMTGTKLKRPPTPHSEAVEEVSVALSEALARALEDAGEGPRERQSAASRVFRVWRSDEAEQRLRELAIRAYQQGVEKSVATLDD